MPEAALPERIYRLLYAGKIHLLIQAWAGIIDHRKFSLADGGLSRKGEEINNNVK